MLFLAKPSLSARITYEVSISRVNDGGLRARLQAAAPHIESETAIFESLADAGRSHEFLHVASPGVTTGELVDVYDDRFARKEGPGRHIYDQLRISAPDAKCALCGHRDAKTLDHYLPKRHFANLVVAPLNLIPACRDCNFVKLNRVATTNADQTINPYFDQIDDSEVWMLATVVHSEPAAVRFDVACPPIWTPELVARVHKHFEVFELGSLYASQAAGELALRRRMFSEAFDAGGREGLRRLLLSFQRSAAGFRPNGWQAVLYTAWRLSDWFVDGGFRPTGLPAVP